MVGQCRYGWCLYLRRHFELIQQVILDGGEKVLRDQQGFWTDDNRFVMRPAALTVAIRNGQITEDQLINKGVLTSEDLW